MKKHFLACLSAVAFTLAGSLGLAAESVKPMIGINVDVAGDAPKEASIQASYYEAIKMAGGIPVLLPPLPAADVKSALSRLDGLLLIGGLDYPSALYGQEPNPKNHVMHQDRAQSDMELVKAAMAIPNMPVLGICAGCQAMNIGTGGSLVQDIPAAHPESKVVHATKPGGWKAGFNTHEVKFESGSKLASIYQTSSMTTVTSHHQCVGKVGSAFKVVAHTEDGSPEAIEAPGQRFAIGVQFHPERDYEHNQKLFAALVEQASLRHVSQQH